MQQQLCQAIRLISNQRSIVTFAGGDGIAAGRGGLLASARSGTTAQGACSPPRPFAGGDGRRRDASDLPRPFAVRWVEEPARKDASNLARSLACG
jgi:hypothetical protein